MRFFFFYIVFFFVESIIIRNTNEPKKSPMFSVNRLLMLHFAKLEHII